MKRLIQASRFLHKVLGLALCAFLTVIITLSGVFDWIAGRKRKSPAAR